MKPWRVAGELGKLDSGCNPSFSDSRLPRLLGFFQLVGLLLVGSLLMAGTSSASTLASTRDSGGLAVSGQDTVRALPPAGAQVADYRNSGYRLDLEDGEARVVVDLAPLESSSPFVSPEADSGATPDPVYRLARTQTLGAKTEYEAVSRVLSWVSRNITYHLDRSMPQTAIAVLERRTAFCTGIARLTVAMLEAVGIEAREVAGIVLSDDKSGPNGYHRWVEIHYQDVGWVFSDPLYSHHYVPATYVRLSDEKLMVDRGLQGVLLERIDKVAVVDLSPGAGPGIRSRRNSERRLAAAVQVNVAAKAPGLVVLESDSRRLRHMLVDGRATFLGLEPGNYRLQVMLTGYGVVERRIHVVGRQRTTIDLAASFSSRRASKPRPATTIGGSE